MSSYKEAVSKYLPDDTVLMFRSYRTTNWGAFLPNNHKNINEKENQEISLKTKVMNKNGTICWKPTHVVTRADIKKMWNEDGYAQWTFKRGNEESSPQKSLTQCELDKKGWISINASDVKTSEFNFQESQALFLINNGLCLNYYLGKDEDGNLVVYRFYEYDSDSQYGENLEVFSGMEVVWDNYKDQVLELKKIHVIKRCDGRWYIKQ